MADFTNLVAGWILEINCNFPGALMTGDIIFINHTTYSRPNRNFVNQGYISHSGPANLTLHNLTFLHGDLLFNLASTF